MMKTATLVALAMLTTASSAAFAQANSPSDTPANTAPGKAQANGATVRQQLTTNLTQSGFTDVKLMPESFLVQAKDKTGNPVTMFITPDSVAEVTTTTNGRGASDLKPEASSGGMFANVPAKDDLSSNVVGLDVYNSANQDIGTIKDVAFNAGGLNGYIIGVGGFLGMGDHYVAVRPSAVSLTFNANEKKWHATMNVDSDQLKAAPEYKYPSKS
jgi:hypothetical protein